MCIAEYLQDFCWIDHFPLRPLNIPCLDDPLGISIVPLVHVSYVIFRVPCHDSLVCLVCYLILKLFPFSDVGNTFKLLERTDYLRFLSMENFKWTLCTTHISHTIYYAFVRMNSICPHHFLSCFI